MIKKKICCKLLLHRKCSNYQKEAIGELSCSQWRPLPSHFLLLLPIVTWLTWKDNLWARSPAGLTLDPGCKVMVIRPIMRSSQLTNVILWRSWSAAKVAAQNNDGKIESIPGRVVMLVLTDWFTSFPRTSSAYNRLEGDNENLLMKLEKWFLTLEVWWVMGGLAMLLLYRGCLLWVSRSDSGSERKSYLHMPPVIIITIRTVLS